MIDELPSKYTYSGDGTTTDFPFPSPIGAQENLVVTIIDANDDKTVLVYQRDYAVDPVIAESDHAAMGKVRLLIAAPLVTDKIVIARKTPINQETEYNNQGPYFSEITEKSLDKLTRIAQEQNDRITDAEEAIAQGGGGGSGGDDELAEELRKETAARKTADSALSGRIDALDVDSLPGLQNALVKKADLINGLVPLSQLPVLSSDNYIPQVNAYINNDTGNDANDGSSSAPFKTNDGMFAALQLRYKGIIGKLNVTYQGTTPITGDLVFPDATAGVNTVVYTAFLAGLGMDATTIETANNGLLFNRFTKFIDIRNLTLNVNGTGDVMRVGGTEGLPAGALVNNVRFNRSTKGRGIIAPSFSWVRIRGDIESRGLYSYIFTANNKGCIYAEALTSLKFTDVTADQIMTLAACGTAMFYTSIVSPVFSNVTLTRSYNLALGSEFFLPAGAALADWTNGASILRDATSTIWIGNSDVQNTYLVPTGATGSVGDVLTLNAAKEREWKPPSGSGGGTSSEPIIGELRWFMSRKEELPSKWYFPTGDYVEQSSAVGKVLMGFTTNHKSDWGIVTSGTTVRLFDPDKFFATDEGGNTVGRFPRAVDGVTSFPGDVQDDAIQNLTGTFSPQSNIGALNIQSGFDGIATGVFKRGPTAMANAVGYQTKTAYNLLFDASQQVRTGSENRPFSVGLTPAIYLGV